MDALSAARSARENLARGLAALQSPGLPPQLMGVADPVAQAMSALHRIEASGGAATVEAAPAALAFVRQALALLQSQQVSHPAVDQGIEAIAGSLGLVHQLAQSVTAPAAAPAQYAAPQAAPPVSPYAGTMMATQAAPAAPPPQAYAAPQAAPPNPPAAPAHAGGVAYAQNPPPAAAAARPAPAMPAGMQRFEAALGAHSPTNFYKGLSGNDVIESGGIFIATYQIPAIGTNIVVHVSLPGGYEFDAQAVVRWTRDSPNSQPSGGQEAPPGFGAQFLNISPEGRQLVYRYVRNREPLFHDDL